jgi:hypothetical protein
MGESPRPERNRMTGTVITRLRTRRCIGRRTRPGRRVRAGGLCAFPAANSFAPAGGFGPMPVEPPRLRTRRCLGRRAPAPPSPRRRTLRLSSGEFIRSRGGLRTYARRTAPVADAQVPGTPHTLRPPSPRRRTLRISSGEFIRSRGRTARYRLSFATGIIRSCRR